MPALPNVMAQGPVMDTDDHVGAAAANDMESLPAQL
jgi:hypothetical protein